MSRDKRECEAFFILISLTGDGHFRYSPRGLVFLWGQFIKDMVRLC